jgi:hypothetical protein
MMTGAAHIFAIQCQSHQPRPHYLLDIEQGLPFQALSRLKCQLGATYVPRPKVRSPFIGSGSCCCLLKQLVTAHSAAISSVCSGWTSCVDVAGVPAGRSAVGADPVLHQSVAPRTACMAAANSLAGRFTCRCRLDWPLCSVWGVFATCHSHPSEESESASDIGACNNQY